MATSSPENTTVPILTRLPEPKPLASSRGKKPAREEMAVSRIGLRRAMAAPLIAVSRSSPSAMRWLANSTIKMPFLAARLTSTSKPIWP